MRGNAQDMIQMREIADAHTDKIYSGYPKTKEEWIEIFEQWFEPELLNIANCFIGKSSAKFIEAKNNKDYPKCCDFLSSIWCNAPDDIRIHSLPGWNVLCDLCSESYVLFE